MTQIKQPRKWVKAESPNFVTFSKIGDTIEGLLMSRTDGAKMTFYTIKTFDGSEKKFHGTNQLDDILSGFSIPCYVKITFMDTQETANGNMKIFEVCKGEN